MDFFKKIISFNFTLKPLASILSLLFILLLECKVINSDSSFLLSCMLMLWVSMSYILDIISYLALKNFISENNNYSYKTIFYKNLITIINGSLLPLFLSIQTLKYNHLKLSYIIIILVVILILDKFFMVSTTKFKPFTVNRNQRYILSDNYWIKKIDKFLSIDGNSTHLKKVFFRLITIIYILIINVLFIIYLVWLLKWASTLLSFPVLRACFATMIIIYIILFVTHTISIKPSYKE